jgi:hypothetical protein
VTEMGGGLIPPPILFVIPRGCDFIGFAQKTMLKTKRLGRPKARKIDKVTDSDARGRPLNNTKFIVKGRPSEYGH